MDSVKKHIDTIAIITALFTGLMWINGKFNDVDKRFACLEKDIAIIKTVLVMKEIMPNDLAATQEAP